MYLPRQEADKYSWDYEEVELSSLLGLRFGSCEYEPFYVFSVEDQVQWLSEEIRAERRSFEGLLTKWHPHPAGEDAVITFESDDQGPYVVIWDGHHRLAACFHREIKTIRLVVGRQLNKE